MKFPIGKHMSSIKEWNPKNERKLKCQFSLVLDLYRPKCIIYQKNFFAPYALRRLNKAYCGLVINTPIYRWKAVQIRQDIDKSCEKQLLESFSLKIRDFGGLKQSFVVHLIALHSNLMEPHTNSKFAAWSSYIKRV